MTNRGKTISEAEFRRMWQDRSLSLAQIGVALGITREAVRQRGKARNMPPRGDSKTHIAAVRDDDAFRRMWIAGVSTNDLMRLHGCSRSAILKAARRLGLSGRGHAFPGIALDEFLQIELARKLAESAARTQAEMIRRNMADYSGARPTGIDHARGLL